MEVVVLRKMSQGQQPPERKATPLHNQLVQQFLRLSKMRKEMVTLLQVLTKRQILITFISPK